MTARIRLALQDRFAPGATVREQYANAERYGFDAIELSVEPLRAARDALRDRVPVSAICGGYRGWLIDPDDEQRRAAREDLTRLIELAGELGCGCAVVPVWGRTRNLPGLATGRSREEDEAMFVDAMVTLAKVAEDRGSRLFIEPLNRYQNDVCNTVADALRLQERIGSPSVMVMADVFHMNIEESDLAGAINTAAGRLGHLHLADNHRHEPGTGHLDLGPVFAALAALEYDGYATFELAALSGPAEDVLPRSVSYVRALLRDAGIV